MSTLFMNGELTIYTAAAEKERIAAYLSSSNQPEMNLANVSELDAAGLQLLILAKKTAHQQKKNLRFTMHSKAVLDVLELTQLISSFGDPIVENKGSQP